MSIIGTLGIIGCNSLADEIAYLVEMDGDITNIFVIMNPEGQLFYVNKIKRPLLVKTSLIREEDLRSRKKNSKFTVIIWLIPSSLHESPTMLFSVLADTIVRVSGLVDSIFVVHGLCGVSEQKVISILKSKQIPINMLTYPNGEICDDCFGSHVGGKKEYLDFIKKNKFALFVTTGFADYLKRKHENQDIVKMVKDIEELKFTLDTLGFNKIIKLESGVGDIGEFNHTVNSFSKTLGLSIECYQCDLSVFDRSYEIAKNNIARSSIKVPTFCNNIDH